MPKLRIPHGTWVLAGDGRKALFLRNEGDADFPDLKVETVLGTAGAGRSIPDNPVQPRSPWHDLEEHRFARDVVRGLEGLAAAGRIKALIVIAPPRVLADLRAEMPDDVENLVVAELDRDLTRERPEAIAALLTGG